MVLCMQMEQIIEKMQDEQVGVPVRTVKSFMSKIPSVFTGNRQKDYLAVTMNLFPFSLLGSDLIQWMMRELELDDQLEALHLANLMASHGYFFPIDDHVLRFELSHFIIIIILYYLSSWQCEGRLDLLPLPDALLLALQLLGAGEHRLRGVPVQANNAEQNPPRAGRLRGGEPGPSAEDVQPKVGVHLHAGGGSSKVRLFDCGGRGGAPTFFLDPRVA